MESEQSQNFNERLSQWVANQGFWFQIRYSMVGSGAKGTAMFHILRLGARVLVFLLILAVFAGYYLLKRTEMKGFNDAFRSSLKTGLSASEIEIRGLARVQGELGINGLACKGDKGAFFNTMDARNIHCNMGFLDGLAGQWKPGTISIARLDMELRAGADDAEAARMLGDSLFQKFDKVELKTFEIADATVRWGYSRTVAPVTNAAALNPDASQGYEFDHTRGSISNSFLRIQRTDDELRLSFKGGRFTQNWLEKLDIVDLEIVCTRDGMVFQKAEFRLAQGTVSFSGLKVAGGARPLINGTVKLRGMALSGIVPPPVRSFVEGSLSGEFHVSGSTNSSEGIVFDGGITLDSPDVISLRERLHLLKALSVVDYSRNYHRIDFREGSLHLKTSGGGLELTDVNLKSDDLTTLVGKMSVKLPSVEEITSGKGTNTSAGGAPLFHGDDDDVDLSDNKDEDLTLRGAGEATNRDKKPGQPEAKNTLFDRLELDLQKRRIDQLSSDRLSRTLRYDGLFRITLPSDVFERAPKLIAQFPVDPASGRVPLMVPIEGGLYEITLKQAEEIYTQGRR
ncbi:MAG: hypothetical protein ABIS50_24500 [Luteolibacter sp.]|uniref:hypothetical protein n=1 Tax=Luteolibacter sp. TaxID=1962973 RepID=UPI003262FA66